MYILYPVDILLLNYKKFLIFIAILMKYQEVNRNTREGK